MVNFPPPIKGHPIYSKIWDLTRRKDKSFLCVCTGPPGSGKSVSGGGRFLYDLDRQDDGKPRFTVDKVVFDPKDFLKLLKKDMPKGSGVLWDEVGVAIPKREWYTLRNRLISQVFQTMRFKNRVMVLTVPALSFLDSHVGPLMNGLLVMEGSNTFTKNVAYGRFYWVDYNARRDKFYYIRPKGIEDGLPCIYNLFALHKPPEDWVQAYREKQEEAKQKIIENAEDLIGYMAKYIGKKVKSDLTDAELYEIVKADIDEYLNADRTKVLSAAIMAKHKGLDYRVAARVARLLTEEIKGGKIVV